MIVYGSNAGRRAGRGRLTDITHAFFRPRAPSERFGVIGAKQRAHLVDLSRWNVIFDPAKVQVQLDGVIHKVTEGTSWVDPTSSAMYGGARTYPVCGAYHYLRSGVSGAAQATHFLNQIHGRKYEILACDFEGTYNTMDGAMVRVAYDFMSAVAMNRNERVMLYTSPSIYDTIIYPNALKLYGRDVFLDFPFWIAQYYLIPSPDKEPSMPARRRDWRIWQYTSHGVPSQYGSGGNGVDLNVYNGGLAEFLAWAGGSSVPPPDGGTMKGLMKSGYSVNVRDAANVVVAALREKDVVYGTLTTSGRERISFSKIYRANGTVENLGKVCSSVTNDGGTPPLYYMTLTNDVEPVPTAGAPREALITDAAGVQWRATQFTKVS